MSTLRLHVLLMLCHHKFEAMTMNEYMPDTILGQNTTAHLPPPHPGRGEAVMVVNSLASTIRVLTSSFYNHIRVLTSFYALPSIAT